MRLYILLLCAAFAGCGKAPQKDVVLAEESLPVSTAGFGKAKLSEYNFFKGPLRDLQPADQVFPYSLNSALFSDYAYKARFIALPPGTSMNYHNTESFEFPEGAVLIKNFYYPADFRKPEGERRIIETRLLLYDSGEWNPLTYVWNDEQTDAELEVSGRNVPASWTHSDGVVKNISYSVPSVNQCRSCHLKGQSVMPVGPTARNLNKADGSDNQLATWQREGKLTGLPAQGVPKLAAYDDQQAPIDARARAWLEINCAHCHRPDGQAKNSGLHLMASVTEPMQLGVGKAPVAAGKGSGGRLYGIVPGKPEESILLYRIESTDIGVMMPEVGRSLTHEEGVALIRQWIAEMR